VSNTPLPGPFGTGEAADRIRAKAQEFREHAERQAKVDTAYASLITTDLEGCDTLPHPPALERWASELRLQRVCVIATEPGEPKKGVGFMLLAPAEGQFA
jgi:hypothetical protein